jgi:hypothetical protein
MCIIDHKKKIIYIAVPKTGTTSIQKFLKRNLPNSISVYLNTPNDIGLVKHSTALEIKNVIKNYEDYHTFAVIRNPFDWYASWYTYAKDPAHVVDSQGKSLKEFINSHDYLNKELLSYFTDENGKIIVDTIIKYEDNLEKELYKIMDNLSIKIEKPLLKLNVSKYRKEKNYKKYFDEETINIVKNIQSKSLEFFNYEY